MNFLEALSELKEGRCEGIKLVQSNYVSPVFKLHNHFITMADEFFKMSNALMLLSDEWTLVNPKPSTTTVEVEYYAIVDETGKVCATYNRPFQCEGMDKGMRNVKLTGSFEKVVPIKVKRREILNLSNVYCDDVKFYAEWFEDAK